MTCRLKGKRIREDDEGPGLRSRPRGEGGERSWGWGSEEASESGGPVAVSEWKLVLENWFWIPTLASEFSDPACLVMQSTRASSEKWSESSRNGLN